MFVSVLVFLCVGCCFLCFYGPVWSDANKWLIDWLISDIPVCELGERCIHCHVLWCTVYGLAKFHMANPFVYTTGSCDEQLIGLKYASLMTAACKRYSDEKCPFRGRKDCYKRRLSEVATMRKCAMISQQSTVVFKPCYFNPLKGRSNPYHFWMH